VTGQDQSATDVTEALDRAWQLVEEANELALYASRLIENTTLKAQLERVRREMYAAKLAYLRLVSAWDVIPECRAIHRSCSPTTMDQQVRPRDPEAAGPAPVGELP
jgi:hypothetical protein